MCVGYRLLGPPDDPDAYISDTQPGSTVASPARFRVAGATRLRPCV